ncbi:MULTISPECIES: hypothetical protein [Leptospira]|uniref:hypothetical protein n=1 Tax=Leptospira TaxID=171 RepID=UPI000B2D7543|nr:MULTISPECIES: hypothetical protein [Leptospira]
MKISKKWKYSLVVCCILMSLPLFSGEKEQLGQVKKDIDQTGETCSCYNLITSSEDILVYGVNYYIGFFKELLKSSHKEEAKKKAGNKRKWIVSKSQGVGESVYLYNDYDAEDKFKVLSELYDLQFKNYCEAADGKKEEYSRIKSAKLTFFEAPYSLVNNAITPRLDAGFKKTKEFDVEIGDSEEIASIFPAYTVLGATKGSGSGGSVFVVKLTVTGVYPGKKSALCVQDFYLGRKARGKYSDLVKQVDEINK